MSEQKTLTDALKEASTLLLDGDEGYKLQRVAELLQQVAELTKENERQKGLYDIANEHRLAMAEEIQALTEQVEKLKEENAALKEEVQTLSKFDER